MPDMPTEQVIDMTQFVGESSWSLFKAIGCKDNFLSKVTLHLVISSNDKAWKFSLYHHDSKLSTFIEN